MSEQFYTILTKIGKAKIANAAALGNQIDLVKFQIGDGNGVYYNPNEDQTQLKNKVWEGNISSIRVDEENPNWIVLETLIPGTDGGFMVREAAAVDNEGNLIAIGKYPETYKPVAGDGSIKDLIIKMIIEVSNTSAVTLKVDPTVILATKNDILELDNKIKNIKLIDTKVKLTDPDNLFEFEDEANINQAILANKTSILKNAKEIENLKQSASNGKNIVATAIGSPLQASDTFATMGTKIDTLTENFRNNLASKGIECLPTDKLSVLVNKVSQFKLFQKFPGTSEEIINDRSECTSTDVVGVWQLKRTIPIEEYFHGIRMSYITVGVFGFTSKIEHIRGNQILTSNSTSDQSTKITLDIMDLQVGDKILMYAQTNENYEGNKSYGGWKNLVISYSWRPVEGEEV